MVKKRKEAHETAITVEPVVIESASRESKLRENLEEIKNYDGVVGYILRNTTSASIDLKDPAKIVNYAMLSSASFDTTEELAPLFQLSYVKDVVIKGKNLKMLSLSVEENKISIFMENDADAEKILKKIQAV